MAAPSVALPPTGRLITRSACAKVAFKMMGRVQRVYPATLAAHPA